MIETLFSARGLLSALLLFLIVLLVFYSVFYRPARKVQVSRTMLSALLATSLFNLIVISPFTILFAASLKIYVLALWWIPAWFPFMLANLFFLILAVGLIVRRKWASFPVTEEMPVVSLFGLSTVFEIFYVMACPFATVIGAGILMAISPDIYNTFL
jgi:hypothetical protein